MQRLRLAPLLATALALSAGPAAAESLFDPDRTPALAFADAVASIEYYASGAARPFPGLSIALLAAAASDAEAVYAEARAEAPAGVGRPVASIDAGAPAEVGAVAIVDASGALMPAAAFYRPRVYAMYDTVALAAEGYVSVLRERYLDVGGAHPTSDYRSWLWRLETATPVGLAELLQGGQPPESFVAAWRAELERLKRARLGDEAGAAGMADTVEAQSGLVNRPFTLAPSTEPGKAAGVTIHHAAGDVGSHAEGPYSVTVPLDAFAAALAPAHAGLFAGAPY